MGILDGFGETDICPKCCQPTIDTKPCKGSADNGSFYYYCFNRETECKFKCKGNGEICENCSVDAVLPNRKMQMRCGWCRTIMRDDDYGY